MSRDSMDDAESPRTNGLPQRNGFSNKNEVSPRNGITPKKGISPRNGSTPRNYSPRRQHIDAQKVQQDLEKNFEALRIHDAQTQRLYEYNRKLRNEKADDKERERAILDENALRLQREKREAVAAEAEATLRRCEEEKREEQRRKAEEERLRQQQEAQAKAERDRQIKEAQEQLRRAEEERHRAEAERDRQEKERAVAAETERQREAAEAKQKQADVKRQEAEAKQRDEERKAQEATQQAQASEAQKQADNQAQRSAAAKTAAEADSPGRAHEEYLALYHKIKAWKNGYWEHIRAEAKTRKNPEIKEAVGEVRRLIKTEVGKQSSDKNVNKMAIQKLKSELTKFLKDPTPVIGTRVPVNDFLPQSLKLDDNNETTITDRGAYFLCVLTQGVVKIFTTYVHGEPERAEPVGTLLALIFAQADLQFQRGDGTTQSLFPIFLAKYHRVCPALFGITADQSTPAGKQKLGWALMPSASDDQPKTTFVADQTHYDRMKGLAMGFSSFGLRNFSAAANKNPYPPTQFWKSLAQLINMNPNQVQPTHVCVLRYMFGHGGISRFLLFFGAVGIAVLREAFVEFPNRLSERMQQDSYVKELKICAANLGENEHLHLA